MTPFGRSSFGTSSPSSSAYHSQYSAYAPNAFGNMLGSFSLPQQQRQQLRSQTRSPWHSNQKQKYSSDGRPPTSYRIMDPPSPTNSSFTTASSASESLSPQTSSSIGESAGNQPLSGWTTGKNSQWRTRLIGMLSRLKSILCRFTQRTDQCPDYCQEHDLPQPMYHTFSDKRGKS